MAKNNVVFNKFNRGKIDRKALGREDLENIPFFAEELTNYIPRILGDLEFRPGFEFKNSIHNNNKAYFVPFIQSITSKSKLEFTNSVFRPYDDNGPVSRPSVSSTLLNGNFDTDLSNWTDDDEGSATSTWLTGGYLSLLGTGFSAAVRVQSITISTEDQGVEHAIRLKVARGRVGLRVGISSTDGSYINIANLEEGEHSITFTPTVATVYIAVYSRTSYASLVDSCQIEVEGYVQLPTPYTEDRLSLIRYEQSLSVVYLTDGGSQQRKVQRWGEDNRSWSLVKYSPEDGPFDIINITGTTLTPSGTTGNITLTASSNLFTADNIGGLYKITSSGQEVTASFDDENQFGDYISVSGVGADRRFEVVITGTWDATVTIQRSFDEGITWRDYRTFTTNQTTGITDGQDNVLIWYRIGIKTGEYTSGTIECTLDYPLGIGTGIVKVVGYTNEKVVSAIVLKPLGNTDPSTSWYEGSWSDRRGWPDTVKLFDGRLCFFGLGRIFHSVSEAYESFDDEEEGESMAFQRPAGRGPTEKLPWALSLRRIIFGSLMSEHEEKASSLDEAITFKNANVRAIESYGSAEVMAQEASDGGVFIDKSGRRLLSVATSGDGYGSYSIANLSKLVPELCPIGETYIRIAIQKHPDLRFHCVRSDGKVDILAFDTAEDVKGWTTVETNGDIEDAIVLPAIGTDEVYYTIKRVINDSTVRYLEKWAKEEECIGGNLNKQADAFYEYNGVSTNIINNLNHLEGEEVITWGDGKYLGTYTVVSGSITLGENVTSCIVGLKYNATYKSTKMLFAQQGGTALSQKKRVSQAGLLLVNTHQLGVKYGTSLSRMDFLPPSIDGVKVSSDKVWDEFDKAMFAVDGEWLTDSRFYLQSEAPFPCTVLGIVLQMVTNDRG